MKYKHTVREARIEALEAILSDDGLGDVFRKACETELKMLQETVEEKWKPAIGQEYFYPNPTFNRTFSGNRYYCSYWLNDSVDESRLEHNLVCKTKEEAQEKAEKMLAVLKDK
jgi:hypothetical protein